MSVKKHSTNGTWGYDIRHPVTGRRKRTHGFRTKGEADQAKSNQIDRWRAEKFGTEYAGLRGSGAKLLLRDELIVESGLLREEYGANMKPGVVRKSFLAAWTLKLADFFPATLKVSDFTRTHVEMFIQNELRRGLKPGSVNTRVTNLRTVLRRIRDRNRGALELWDIPTAKVTGFVGRSAAGKLRRVWTDEEFDAILAILREPDRHYTGTRKNDIRRTWREVHDFLLIGALTGMRKTEILLLQPRHIHFKWRIMKARTLKRKNGAEVYRDIPIGDDLEAVLRSRLDMAGVGATFLFERFKGDYAADWIYHSLRTVCEIAGIEYGQKNGGVVPHGLRHTAATKMVTGDVDIATAAEILGNSVETMLTSYAHTTMSSKVNAMSKLGISTSVENRDNVVQLRKTG